jgi:predicted amidohydrolase
MIQSGPIASKPRNSLRLGAYQGTTEPGALERNGANALRLLAKAKHMGVDFACMPECYLSGYGTPKELRTGTVSITSRWFRDWIRQCAFGDMVSIVGFMEQRGKAFHNSAAIIQRGRLIGVYRKSIPGSPHEAKVVTYLCRFPVFRAHGVTFGVIICYEASVIEPGRKMGDDEGFGYGDSFILDSIGRPRAEAGTFTVGWITADVPKREVTGKRESRVRLVPAATRAQVAKLYR